MLNIRNASLKEKIIAFSIFLVATLYLLKSVLLSPGMPLGNDWGFPFTTSQIKVLAKMMNCAWQYNSLVPYRNWNVSTATLYLIWAFFANLGITGDILSKGLLLLAFLVSGFSLFILLRFFNLGFAASILGGLIFITTPIFFNYTIMGWIVVLLILGLMPLTIKHLILSVENNSWRNAATVAVLFAIAFWQSQALVWFLLLFLLCGIYIVKSSDDVLPYIFKCGVIGVVFFLLNLHILLPLLIVPDPAVTGTDQLQTGVSLGTIANFYPLNIFRLYGSLFNYQYENIIRNHGLTLFSWFVPFLAVAGLFTKYPRRLKTLFLFIALIPFCMYQLNYARGLLVYIPFSNLIRDFARFSIFSALGYSMLAALTLDQLIKKPFSWKKVAICTVLTVFGIGTLYPWLTDKLVDVRRGLGSDNRLATKVYPASYMEVEQMMSKVKLDARAAYWPFGGFLEFVNDPGFHGAYHEAADIFGYFSPISGIFTISDRNLINSTLQREILDSFNSHAMSAWIPNLRYVIVRTDSIGSGERIDQLAFRRELSTWLDPIFHSGSIDVYRTRTFQPHFYSARNAILSDSPLDIFAKYVEDSQYHRLQVFLDYHMATPVMSSDVDLSSAPQIEFHKLKPTKFAVHIRDASPTTVLVFNEPFHTGWKLYTSHFHEGEEPSNASTEFIDSSTQDQATQQEVEEFIRNRWITVPGKGHKLQFVSGNFDGVIQNDNLKTDGMGLWFKPALPEKFHLKANGYSNAWIIDAKTLCDEKNVGCRKSENGKYELNFVIEFWPQRVYIVSLLVSTVGLLVCLLFIFAPFGKSWREKRTLS